MRITEKMLQLKVDYLNKICGFNYPKYPITVGSYWLSFAYGGVSLHQLANTSGGVHDVFSCGHVPKRELFYRLDAYIAGINK